MSFGPKTGYRDGGNRGGQDRFKWEDVKDGTRVAGLAGCIEGW
jgi:hypothetical protein